MQVNQETLDGMLKLMGSKTAQEIFDFIGEKSGKTHSDILRKISDKNIARYDSGKVSYYLRKMRNYKMLTVDKETKLYYLSPIGMHLIRLVNEFKKLSMEYSMDELDKNGKPKKEVRIIGRKLKKSDLL